MESSAELMWQMIGADTVWMADDTPNVHEIYLTELWREMGRELKNGLDAK